MLVKKHADQAAMRELDEFTKVHYRELYFPNASKKYQQQIERIIKAEEALVRRQHAEEDKAKLKAFWLVKNGLLKSIKSNLLDEKMAHKRRVVCTRKFIINCHQVRILKQLSSRCATSASTTAAGSPPPS